MAPQVNLKMRFAIAKLLEEHTVLDGKYVVFKEGWSDERIAEVIGCQPGNVVGTRKAVLGGLKPSQSNSYTGNQYTQVRETLAQHERTLEDHQRTIINLDSRILNLQRSIELLSSRISREYNPDIHNSQQESHQAQKDIQKANTDNSGESPNRRVASWVPIE